MADVEPTLDRAAEQARIRKERREAKIRAGGSARLNKITGLGGGVQRGIMPCPAIAVLVNHVLIQMLHCSHNLVLWETQKK